MKTAKTMRTLVFLTLFLLSSIVYLQGVVTPGKALELPTKYPMLFVYPDLINETYDVGQTFTISVVAYNLTDGSIADPDYPLSQISLGNMYAFDLQFSWDPSIVHHISHTITAPVETYSSPIPPANYSGILHASVTTFTDTVDEAGNIPGAVSPDVRAWFVASSFYPAEPFNGNGTIFTMTFEVVGKGESALKIEDAILATQAGDYIGRSAQGDRKWLNPPINGRFILGAPAVTFGYSPSVGVVNKATFFDATLVRNSTSIVNYMWNFGDGTMVNTTGPAASHNYTASGRWTASLVIEDANLVKSGNVTLEVLIVDKRDLWATSIYPLLNLTKLGRAFSMATTVENLGSTSSLEFSENCTLTVSYNATVVNSQNITDTVWVPLTSNETTVTTFKQITLMFNSTNIQINGSVSLALEKYYFFLLNVTGIPTGYESNTANNLKVSDFPMFFTNQTVYNPKIDTFNFGYLLVRRYELPVILGENSTFDIIVVNAGTDPAPFNITLYTNGSILNSWQTAAIEPGDNATITYKRALDIGYYNVTLEAEAGTVTDIRQGALRVVDTPLLVVNYSPTNPVAGQEVSFDASGSVHQDPTSSITGYAWSIYKPGTNPGSATPVKTFTGADMTAITYAFNASGKWTVVLVVSDNNLLTFDSSRASTDPYRKVLEITVGAGGFPLEWIIAIVVIVIVVVAVIVFMLLRRRRKVPPGQTETTTPS